MFIHLVFRLKFELVKSALARRTRGIFYSSLDSGRTGSEEQTYASDQLAAGGQSIQPLVIGREETGSTA